MPDTISLGPVRNSATVWVNGIVVSPQAVPGGRGRGGQPPAPPAPGQVLRPTPASVAVELEYPIPAGTLRAGENTITVRVQNGRAEGGFIGSAGDMHVRAGQARTPLAGTWKYRVERSANTGPLYSKPGELAAHVAFTEAGGMTGAAAAALPTERAVPDVVVQLGVIPNEMQFSTKELTVQAGQMVEIVFTNPDQMQHNFVLGTPGSLEAIGAASDVLAMQPGAASTGYVPDMPQVIVKTPLVDPGQSFTVQFRAPAQAGQYPYVCTFPAHWRVMNGILNVVEPPGRGRGAGGRGAGAAGRAGGAGAGGRGQ
jgi:azurin